MYSGNVPLRNHFAACILKSAAAVAAKKALTTVIQRSEASTMMGLDIDLKKASEVLKAWDATSISFSAGCNLFLRYITRTSALEYEDISAGKARLIERGEKFGDISLKHLHYKCTYFDEKDYLRGQSISRAYIHKYAS